MTAKRKRQRARSARHIASRLKGIVTTPLRLAFDLVVVPRRDLLWRWECPPLSETVGRLAGGRATHIRKWATGKRRAPAWFVAVLVSELRAQIEHRQAILEQLARYETGDRRRSPEARARARALRMRQLGRPIGNSEAPGSPQASAGSDPCPSTPEPK